MKEQQKLEIKVGITVIAGLIILFGGFAIFKEWSLLDSQKQLVMRFPTSAGLQSGDNVSLNGVDIGKVTSVLLDGTSVLVHANIGSDVNILTGSIPRIQMLELMGGKKVEIIQGKGPGEIAANVVIEGEVDPDIAGALHLMGELEGNVRSLTDNANELMENANTIIGDEEFVKAIKETAVTLKALATETKAMLAENRNDIREITATTNRLTKNIDSFLVVLEPRLTTALDHSDNTLTSVDSLIGTLHEVVKDIRHGNGLASKLLYDETFTKRLDSLMTKVDSVFQIIINEDLKIRLRI